MRAIRPVALTALGLIAVLVVPGVAAAAPSDPRSVVSSPDSGGANLRTCPNLPNPDDTTNGCGIVDWLPNGTHVMMRCWRDGAAPYERTSPRWFWVTVGEGPKIGWSGYVWSELVADQTSTPPCDGPLFQYQPDGPKIWLEPGPAAPHGFRYAITLSGFPANSQVALTCHDSVSPEGFFSFSLITDESGWAFTERQCYSADGPDHWVTADGLESPPVSW
ncbi:hypothetical protein [Micromonospora chersina]|uniref:SH3 domain-containing protein n=1 Tax=Micromonospora chersina TaxID=47854 RepID=A0A1C6URL4_9ACTN|nr:hypothetical protein [Micromonospora chersina]SCL56439.1 hypothetical protein GA0070603_2208 [Micromonospora chersina]